MCVFVRSHVNVRAGRACMCARDSVSGLCVVACVHVRECARLWKSFTYCGSFILHVRKNEFDCILALPQLRNYFSRDTYACVRLCVRSRHGGR